ncbi:hypothetical protein SDC9_109899 [bioreactor metagenome]|uniref:O-antigen ligase n=1 Tax=bioreactor metagenome TaxID=1076179 RepID=A0A645BED3_9ZZZZ
MILESSKNEYYLCLFSLLIMMVLEDGTYISMYQFSVSLVVVLLLILMVLVTIFKSIMVDKVSIQLNTKSLFVAIIMISSLLLNLLITNDPSVDLYLKLCIQIIIAMYFVSLFKFHIFIEAFVDVLIFLSVYSLIATYLAMTFPEYIKGIFPLLLHEEVGYTNVLINMGLTFTHTSDVLMHRNYGMFREPGLYQFYLIMALIIELWYKKDGLIVSKLIILTVTIISTFSTAGLIAGMIIIIAYLSNNRIGEKKYIKYTTFTIIACAILFYIPQFNEYLIRSIMKLDILDTSSSYDSRWGSLKAMFELWLMYPIIGSGYTEGSFGIGKELLNQYTKDNTNTTITNFALYGVVYGIIHLYAIVRWALISHQKKVVIALLICGIILSMNNENCTNNLLIVIFMFYALTTKV